MSFSDCPIAWADAADTRDAWVARVDHLMALSKRHTEAGATLASRYADKVLAEARLLLAARSQHTPKDACNMMVDEYNVAWKEYLKWRHHVTDN